MPSKSFNKIYPVADEQLGYFTAAQAAAVGVPTATVRDMKRRGVVENTSFGVYRLVNYPISPFGQFMEAMLWPQGWRKDLLGVISHVSALSIYDMSDASPNKIHITLPPGTRIRRTIPAYLVVHYEMLSPKEIRLVEGIQVTIPVRTIYDCRQAHLSHDLIRQAIQDGRQHGLLSTTEAAALIKDLRK